MVDDAFQATLTYARNSDNTNNAFKPTLSELKLKRASNTEAEVKELFVKHFEVKFVNVWTVNESDRRIGDWSCDGLILIKILN